MKSRMFIGSSRESLELAYAVQENLEHDFEVTVWTQGLFDPSNYILDGLLDVLDEVDFGSFIFAPNDVTRMRGQDHRVVRDNVIFELGLFIGRLGRERNFMFMPRGVEDLRLPTDLLGLTPATFEPNRQDGNNVAALGPACNKVKKAAAKIKPPQPVNPEEALESGELDDNDCISLIESWMGSRPMDLNTQAMKFSDIDRELGLPAGSAKKFIETAARRWGYVPGRKGNNTILLRDIESS